MLRALALSLPWLLSALLSPVMSSAMSAEPVDAGARPMRGDGRERVIALLGDPQGRITIDAGSDDRAGEILCYGDVLIEFVAGRVSRISGVGHWDRTVTARPAEAPATSGSDAGTADADADAPEPEPVVPDLAPACDAGPAVAVVIIESRSAQPGCGGVAGRRGCDQERRIGDRGHRRGYGPSCSTLPPQLPAASTFPLDVVRNAPDPRQRVFDLQDPRTAVLAAPDPRWHGSAPR